MTLDNDNLVKLLQLLHLSATRQSNSVNKVGRSGHQQYEKVALG